MPLMTILRRSSQPSGVLAATVPTQQHVHIGTGHTPVYEISLNSKVILPDDPGN